MNRRLFTVGGLVAGAGLVIPGWTEASNPGGLTMDMPTPIYRVGDSGQMVVSLRDANGNLAVRATGTILFTVRAVTTTVPLVSGRATLPVASSMLPGAYDVTATYLDSTGTAVVQTTSSLLIVSGQPKVIVPPVTIPFGTTVFPVSATIVLGPQVPIPAAIAGVMFWTIRTPLWDGQANGYTGGLTRTETAYLITCPPPGNYPITLAYRQWPLLIAKGKGTLTVTA